MSILSSIFGPSTPAQPAPSQPQPGNIPEGTTPSTPQLANTAPNGVVPSQEENKAAAPLEEFKDLWKNDPNATAIPSSTNSDVFQNVNPDDLMKAASQIDFTKVVTPEIIQAIQAGGEEGTKALLQALNKTQQLGYAQSAHATTVLINKALKDARESFMSELPKHIRDRNTTDLIKETPAYSHPAAAPLVESLIRQMQVKYPDASPKELTDMANKYVTQFADAVKPNQKSEAKINPKEDWDSFLV